MFIVSVKQILYYIAFVLISVVSLYFLFYIINGSSSIFVLLDLKKKKLEMENILQVILSDKNVLQHKVNGLYSNTLDLDLLDEQARNVLGYINNDEYVTVIDKKSSD